MTTAIERLIRECPEGEWLPEGWRIGTFEGETRIRIHEGGFLHKVKYLVKDQPLFVLAVQGRLAELLADDGGVYVAVAGTGEYVGFTDSDCPEPDYRCSRQPTYLDALADAWIAVGRG